MFLTISAIAYIHVEYRENSWEKLFMSGESSLYSPVSSILFCWSQSNNQIAVGCSILPSINWAVSSRIFNFMKNFLFVCFIDICGKLSNCFVQFVYLCAENVNINYITNLYLNFSCLMLITNQRYKFECYFPTMYIFARSNVFTKKCIKVYKPSAIANQR